jgi:hypothetical protein
MTDLLFSQKDGFTDYDPPPSIAWAEGEDEAAWLRRTRYETEWTMGDDGGSPFEATRVICRKQAVDIGAPTYLVEQWDSEQGTLIYVRSRPDVLALKIRLAPLMLESVRLLSELAYQAVSRGFYAYHGHYPSRVCRACDPDAYEIEQDERRAREARKRDSAKAKP